MGQSLWEIIFLYFPKFKIFTPYDPEIALLVMRNMCPCACIRGVCYAKMFLKCLKEPGDGNNENVYHSRMKTYIVGQSLDGMSNSIDSESILSTHHKDYSRNSRGATVARQRGAHTA